MVAALSILLLLFAQGEPAGYAKAVRALAQDFPSAETGVNEVLHESAGYVPGLLLKARISIVQGRMVL